MFLINNLNLLAQENNSFQFLITKFENQRIEKECNAGDTIYGISTLIDGHFDEISIKNGTFAFASKSKVSINGSGVLISSNVKQDFTRVAKVNPTDPGLLKYINNCSNQELISPSVIYNPTIQYLFFPPNIEQTAHIHHSFRLGLVVQGRGIAVANNQVIELTENKLFMLPAGENHYFQTFDSEMSLVVFHPDSDIGPTDEVNNMMVRTVMNHS